MRMVSNRIDQAKMFLVHGRHVVHFRLKSILKIGA
jgi:hypothetical protein